MKKMNSIEPASAQNPARPLRYVKDKDGRGWLCDCDADIDFNGDLEAQGCWRCEDVPFPMEGGKSESVRSIK